MIIYEEIFREFKRKKVNYVIVGGIALNLLGSMRNTADLDILAEMTDDNLRKIVQILKKLGYMVKIPVDPIGIADEKTRREWLTKKHMRALNFYRPDSFEQVDIIIASPVSYEMARDKALEIKADKFILPVISIDHLIKMKKAADRDVDRMDIVELQYLKRLRQKGQHV